jgi:hypothetical protein
VQRVREIIHQGANKYLLNVNVGLRAQKIGRPGEGGGEGFCSLFPHRHARTQSCCCFWTLICHQCKKCVASVAAFYCRPFNYSRVLMAKGGKNKQKKSAPVCLQALWQINLHIAFQLLHLNVKLQKRNANGKCWKGLVGSGKLQCYNNGILMKRPCLLLLPPGDAIF